MPGGSLLNAWAMRGCDTFCPIGRTTSAFWLWSGAGERISCWVWVEVTGICMGSSGVSGGSPEGIPALLDSRASFRSFLATLRNIISTGFAAKVPSVSPRRSIPDSTPLSRALCNRRVSLLSRLRGAKIRNSCLMSGLSMSPPFSTRITQDRVGSGRDCQSALCAYIVAHSLRIWFVHGITGLSEGVAADGSPELELMGTRSTHGHRVAYHATWDVSRPTA